MWWIIIISIVALTLIVSIIIGINVSKRDKDDWGDSDSDITHIGGSQKPSPTEFAGLWGERWVNHHIRPLLRPDEYLLANVLLPLKSGRKTEIDAIIISRRGIFCIETINWVGHISGNDDDEYWLQEYDDPFMSDRRHKNPVKQNEAHCQILEKILNDRFPVDGAVVFAELEDGWGIDSAYTYTINGFVNFYNELSEDQILEPELKPIYQKLQKYVASQEELDKHKEEVRKRYN